MTARRQLLGAAVAAVALAALACGDGGGGSEPAITIDTLPNGVIRTHSPDAGVWDSANAWRFVEEVRIGALEGDGPDVFGDVRDLEVDALGRVWVLDAESKRIQVFEADGRHVRTIGRPGAGPGEFEYAIGLEADPAGRIWVLDARNARFSVFDTAGAPLATHRRESTYTPWQWEGGITDDGRVFDTNVVYDEGPPGRDVLTVRDTSGAPLEPVDLPRFEREQFELRAGGRLMQTTPVPFSPSLVWRLADDGTLWWGTTDAYRLVNTTLDGDTLRVVEKEWTPLPVTPEERAEWLEMPWVAEMREQGADIDESRIPAEKPAWQTFRLDDEGYLWVLPAAATGVPFAYDVFDPEGRYLGSVDFGSPIGSPLLRGDRVYGVALGEFGESYVVIGRLEGRAAGASPR